jgi:hypothetical protein
LATTLTARAREVQALPLGRPVGRLARGLHGLRCAAASLPVHAHAFPARTRVRIPDPHIGGASHLCRARHTEPRQFRSAARSLDRAGQLSPDGRQAGAPRAGVTEFVDGLVRPSSPDPYGDVHVGVISASLGGPFGACPSDGPLGSSRGGDRAHLLAPPEVATYESSGFLTWDPHQERWPPGERDVEKFDQALARMLDYAGRGGCPFPAPLEAAYRFLVDGSQEQSQPAGTTLQNPGPFSTLSPQTLHLQRSLQWQ